MYNVTVSPTFSHESCHDTEGKKQFVGLIFPEKFIFENNQFRAKHLRKAVELICRKTKGFGEDKKELTIKFDALSNMLTSARVW